MPQTEFEDLTGTVIFTLLYLELCKLNEVILVKSICSQLSYHPLEYSTSSFPITVPKLEFGNL